jgi:C1A family cysteine protease
MAYNIVKEMRDPKTGNKAFVLLTDGLSQIWDVKTEKEAERIATMMTQNSDSGWVYKVRKSCERK